MARQPAAQPTLQELIAQARAATRELREAIKDTRQAARDLDATGRRVQAQLTALVEQRFEQLINPAVKEAAEQIAKAQRHAQQQAADMIHDRVAELMRVYLEGEERAAVSLPAVMQARQILRKWNQQAEDRGPTRTSSPPAPAEPLSDQQPTNPH